MYDLGPVYGLSSSAIAFTGSAGFPLTENIWIGDGPQASTPGTYKLSSIDFCYGIGANADSSGQPQDFQMQSGCGQGIPIIGTYTAFFLFGGQYPGTDIEPRMYITHVLLIPGLILALVAAHIFILLHWKHTAMPALGNSERMIRGRRSTRTSP